MDTEAFDATCQGARQTRAPEDYRAAAELYRGDILPEDRFEDWAEGPREAFRERHLGLLVDYATVLPNGASKARWSMSWGRSSPPIPSMRAPTGC